MRSLIAERVVRGKTELTVTQELTGDQTSATLDGATLAAYKRQIEQISLTYGVPEPEDWFGTMLRLPEVLKPAATSLDDKDKHTLYEALDKALDALCGYRLAEGRKLYEFFIGKIEALFHLLKEIEPMEAERVPRIKAKLTEQLAHIDNVDYDGGRLEQELIFYIEKLDVTEEKTRLRAHLNYFLETMGPENEVDPNGCGKKLGFIAQEMGREINTLGSKSNHAGMQRTVVKMKDELEQIKEQVLNVL